ncbi:unnamed protein product [Closterium sp. NIES-64]|nr:unnamed protein product [Closterium sp. NIES-64]
MASSPHLLSSSRSSLFSIPTLPHSPDLSPLPPPLRASAFPRFPLDWRRVGRGRSSGEGAEGIGEESEESEENEAKNEREICVKKEEKSSPSAFLGILLRGTEIVWELTMFFLSLSYDKLVGLDERTCRRARRPAAPPAVAPGPIVHQVGAGSVCHHRGQHGVPLALRGDLQRHVLCPAFAIIEATWGCRARGDLHIDPADQPTSFRTHLPLHPPLRPPLLPQEAFAIIEANMGMPLKRPSAPSLRAVAAASLGQRPPGRGRPLPSPLPLLHVLRPGIEPVIHWNLFLFRRLVASPPSTCPFSAHQTTHLPIPPSLRSLPQVLRPGIEPCAACGARNRTGAAAVDRASAAAGIEPVIYRDLFLFRTLASFLNGISIQKLGCNAELIVDEFGEKLLEELDYRQEARNIQSFYENFLGDAIRAAGIDTEVFLTDPSRGIDTEVFLTVGVSAALRQLLEFGLFHGDPHPGNIFAMRDGHIAYVDFGDVAELSQYNKEILIDAIVHTVNHQEQHIRDEDGRIAYVDFGNVAELSQYNKEILIDAIVHAVNEDYSLADFNFRTVTREWGEGGGRGLGLEEKGGKFNQLVYNFPIRIPERFSLVIRSLLTQEGICLSLEPNFKFLEVAYPYEVLGGGGHLPGADPLLLTQEGICLSLEPNFKFLEVAYPTWPNVFLRYGPDPALRSRLIQVLFKDGVFQWKRVEPQPARPADSGPQPSLQALRYRPSQSRHVSSIAVVDGGLDLRETIRDGRASAAHGPGLRRQLLLAFTQDSRLHVKRQLLLAFTQDSRLHVKEVRQGKKEERGVGRKSMGWGFGASLLLMDQVLQGQLCWQSPRTHDCMCKRCLGKDGGGDLRNGFDPRG